MTDFVLVAHGSPSAPDSPDAVMKRLAEEVARALPGSCVRGATLAKPDSLRDSLQGLANPAIYPLFMAEGWFTRRELPRRLAALSVDAPILPPFGVDPALPDLIARAVQESAKTYRIEPEKADLILAAHGSKVARRSKDSAYAMAATLRGRLSFWRIRVALIEEPPFLTDVASESRIGLCLPFFALRAGHVEEDIPQALESAGFHGPVMAAIGEHPEVPQLIARALADI